MKTASRVAVDQKKNRQWFWWLIVTAACCLTLYIGIRQFDTSLNTIRVRGELSHFDAQKIQLLFADKSPSFFQANLPALQQVIQAMPWVKSAAIRRFWPDTLIIEVEEHDVIARYEPTDAAGELSVDEIALVTSEQLLIRPDFLDETINQTNYMRQNMKMFSTLPVLQGPSAQKTLLISQYLIIKDTLKRFAQTENALTMTGLVMEPHGALKVHLLSQDVKRPLEVMIGRIEKRAEIISRIERLVSVMPHINAHGEQVAKTVDLRYATGAAVAWAAHDSTHQGL